MKSFDSQFEFAKILSGIDSSKDVFPEELTSTLDPYGFSYLLGHLEQQRFQSFSTSAYFKYRPQNLKPEPEQTTCPYPWTAREKDAYQWLNQILNPTDRLMGTFKIDSLRKAYKKAAMKTHPDLGGSHESFLKLQKVHEILVTYLQEID